MRGAKVLLEEEGVGLRGSGAQRFLPFNLGSELSMVMSL